jgi:hypothetical protein
MAVTKSDFKFLIDWYQKTSAVKKYPVMFYLERFFSDQTAGPSLEFKGLTRIDSQFIYYGEVDYLIQASPGKVFPAEIFQGPGDCYPFYGIDWRVNLMLILNPVSMGLWFIGGPYDGKVWDNIHTFDVIHPARPDPDTLTLRFTVPRQTSHEEYRLLLFQGQPFDRLKIGGQVFPSGVTHGR